MNKSHKTLIIIGFVIIAAIGFYGGTIYAKGKSSSSNAFPNITADQRQRFQQMGGAGRNGSGAGTSGSILSMDDKSITVQIRGGGSKLIFYSPSSKVQKMVDGSISDLKAGDNIMAQGTTNSDGSVTAQTIQIRPADMASGPNGTQLLGAPKSSGVSSQQ